MIIEKEKSEWVKIHPLKFEHEVFGTLSRTEYGAWLLVRGEHQVSLKAETLRSAFSEAEVWKPKEPKVKKARKARKAKTNKVKADKPAKKRKSKKLSKKVKK